MKKIKCSECKSKVIAGKVNMNYRLADCRVIVKNVPALVCPSCKQEYIAPSVAKYVNELVNSIRDNSKVFSRKLHLQQVCPKEVAVAI